MEEKNINGIRLNQLILNLIEDITKRTSPTEEQIKDLINMLRVANDIEPLPAKNFDFKTKNDQMGQWDESEQKF